MSIRDTMLKLAITFVIVNIVIYIYIKQTNPEYTSNDNYEKWEWANGLVMNETVVLLGDSITVGKKNQEGGPSEIMNRTVSKLNIQNVTIYNHGKGSDTTAGIISRLESVHERNPTIVIVMAGANDVSRDTVSQFERNMSILCQRLVDNNSKVEIYVSTMTPVAYPHITYTTYRDRFIAYNTMIRNNLTQYNVSIIDTWQYMIEWKSDIVIQGDGIHLTDVGYRMMADCYFDNILRGHS